MSSNTVNQRVNFASTKNPLEYPVDTKKAENIVAQSIRETSYIYAPIQPWNAKKYFAVTAIDRCGNESAPINGDK